MEDLKTSNARALPWPEILTKAAHDMRTPLSSIKVALEILRVNGDDAAMRFKLIAILNNHVEELAEMVDGLSSAPGVFIPSSTKKAN